MQRMVRFDAADPPARIGPAGDRAGRDNLRVQRVAFAQVAPQHRIDQRLRLRAGKGACGVDRAVDHGERGRIGVVELIQRDGNQRSERRVGDGLGRQRPGQRFAAAPMAQCSIGEFLHQRPAAQRRTIVDRRERRRERHAVEDMQNGPGRLLLFDLHCQEAAGAPKRVPGTTPCPAAKADAAMRLPLAG